MPVTRCSLTDLTGRLIALHNAAAAGTWSTSVPAGAAGDKRRNDTELQRAILSSDNKVCHRSARVEGDGYRSLFMADSADLTHGQVLPDHIGAPGQVRIKIASADADYKAGKHDEALGLGDIERWRLNSNGIYGANHDTTNSPIGGYYIIAASEIFFTGYRARVQLANVARTLVCQAPEAYEDLVLADAYLMTKKDGDRSDFVGLINAYARESYALIDAGAMVVPPLQIVQERAA